MKITDYNLHELAKNGDFETLNEILSAVSEEDKKPFLNALDEQKGWFPLHYAIDTGHLDVVRLLLQHGADPNLRDK